MLCQDSIGIKYILYFQRQITMEKFFSAINRERERKRDSVKGVKKDASKRNSKGLAFISNERGSKNKMM